MAAVAEGGRMEAGGEGGVVVGGGDGVVHGDSSVGSQPRPSDRRTMAVVGF